MAALNDTQRLVMESGKALAEELGLIPLEETRKTKEVTLVASNEAELELVKKLGLTESSYVIKEDIEFFDGQTVLVSSPFNTTVGVIHVEEIYERPKSRNTEYYLNDELLFQKSERLKDGKWVSVFCADLNIPANAILYVS